jgi:hypothetical protein
MKKSLRRVLERLRAATNGAFGKRTHARGGLQQPQRMQPALVPVRSTLRG